MSRWMTGILAVIFSWVQCASAFPQQDLPRFKKLMQETGWTQRPLKLKDLYAKAKDSWPLEYRFEIETILAQNPNAELPKLEVRMIKNGNHEDIQLLAVQGKTAVSAVFSFRGDNVGTLTFSSGGKDIRKQLSLYDFFNPTRVTEDVPGALPSYATQVGFARLLHAKEIALLREEDQLKYGAQVRELISVAEKAQNQMNRKREPASRKKSTGKKTSSLQFLKLFLEEAEAQVISGKCLVLGWEGVYEKGVCTPPKEAAGGKDCPGAYQCGTSFYGPGVCGSIKLDPGVANSTTELCNSRVQDSKYNVFKGIKNQAEFNARMDQISLKVNSINLYCKSTKEEQQLKECQDLEKRMAELRAVNCDTLAQMKGEFTDLKCVVAPTTVADKPAGQKPVAAKPPVKADGAAPATPPRSPPPTKPAQGGGVDNGHEVDELEIVQPDEGGPVPVATGGGVDNGGGNLPPTQANGPRPGGQQPGGQGPAATENRCQNLPLNPSGLNCNGGSVLSIACSSGGERRMMYYCDCGSRPEIRTNTALATGCNGSIMYGGSSYTPGIDRYVPKYRREAVVAGGGGINWTQTLGSLLSIGMMGFMIYAQNQNQKAQYAQYYNMMTPQPLTIAPPPTTSGVVTSPYGNYYQNVLSGTR